MMSLKDNGACFVYILNCKDNFHYTGITSKLFNRIHHHFGGSTSFTRRHPPLEIGFLTLCVDRRSAAGLERKIKCRGAHRFMLLNSLYESSLNFIYKPITLFPGIDDTLLKRSLNLSLKSSKKTCL